MSTTTVTETATESAPSFEIPKTCKGGVVVNEGPDFHIVCSSPSLKPIQVCIGLQNSQ